MEDVIKKYCICTMCVGDGHYKQKFKKCVQSQINFCSTHKIPYFCIEKLDCYKDESKVRPEAWYKLKIIKEKLLKYKIVFWIDCDVILFNSNKNYFNYLCDLFVQKQKKVMLAIDDLGNINTGVCVFENNSIDIIEKIWNQEQFINNLWWENASFIYLYNTDQNFRDQCFVIENSKSHILQGYPEHRSEKKGSVIIHFAGWTKKFIENFEFKFCNDEKIINEIKLSLSNLD